MDTIPGLLTVNTPSATAIAAPEWAPLTFADLRAQVSRLAGQLRSLEVSPGDRVAIVLPNGPEMAVTFLAVVSCATAEPLNPNYREEEFRF